MVEYIDFVGISKNTPLAHIMGLGKKCVKCNNCCNYGSGFLLKEDIKNMAGFLKITEEELKQKFLEEGERFNTRLMRPKSVKQGKPYGICIFFNTKKGCTIHPVKPTECRISTCDQSGEAISLWFALNYLVNQNDAESIRQYASFLKTHKTLPGGSLEEIVPDKERLKGILSYQVIK